MSKTVDNRVVEMRFDNAQFEKGIGQSITSLDNLKKGLNLEGAAKGLSELGRVGKTFTLNSIGESVDYVASRFSALSLIGITALQNITNSALETGKRIISSLTIDPIKTGLTEYETKMGAIQTILTNTASKGTKLEDVNAVLNELNAYSDQTIYNFAEMAKNIGTFTAAGVDLKTSATAIKGIANLAAGSGSTSLQASTAMYQLSQALAAGSVKLQDWNSVVNAGMGGELFQNALKDTAKQMGIVVDKSVPFRESLKDGWVTADVLTKTLEKFANDKSLIQAATQVKTFTQLLDTMKESVQSGWAQTWEAIIGDKDQAAVLFTNINNAFGAMAGTAAKTRIEMFQFWNEMGGRRMVIAGLTDALKGVQAILKPIGDAWREIFPAMTGERLVEMSKAFQELMREFKIGAETSANIKWTFKGLFAMLDIGIEVFKGLFGIVGDLLGVLLPTSDGIFGLTASVGEYISNVRDTLKETDGISKFFSEVGGAIGLAATDFKGAVEKISKAISDFAATKGVSFLAELKEKITAPITFIKDLFAGLGLTIEEVKTNVTNFFNGIDWKAVFGATVAGGATGGILYIIKTILDLFKSGRNMMDGIVETLGSVRGVLEAYQNQLKAGTLIKIAAAIGILALALLVLSGIDPEKVLPSVGAMTAIFIELVSAMAILDKFVQGDMSLAKTALAMVGVAMAVKTLADGLTTITEIDDQGKLWSGVGAVAAIIAMMTAAAYVMGKGEGNVLKASIGMNAFANAVKIMVGIIASIGLLEPEQLEQGLMGLLKIVILMAGFSAVFALKGMGQFTTGTGLALVGMAAAVWLVAEAVKKFSEMDPEKINQGLEAMAKVMVAMALFLKIVDSNVMNVGTGLAVIGVAAAIMLLGKSVEQLGEMDPDRLTNGFTAVAGMLLAMAVAIRALPADAAMKSLSLIIVAGALKFLGDVIIKLSFLSWDQTLRGLAALGGTLIILAVALRAMNGTMMGTAALVIAVGALWLLVPVLERLSKLSWEGIFKGLTAIAGVFLVLGVAAAILTPMLIPLALLAATMLIFGVAAMAGGVGLQSFAYGMKMLIDLGPAANQLMKDTITAFLDLIPLTIQKLGEALLALIKLIGDNALPIADAFVKVVNAIIVAIVQTVPAFVDGVFVLLTAFLTTLANKTPELIKQGSAFVRAIMDGLAIELPALIQSAINMMVAFVNGLADGIRNNTEAILLAGQNLITALLEAMFLLLTTSLVDWEQLGKTIMESGFIEGAKKQIDAAVKMAADMVAAVIKKIDDLKDQFFQAGVNVVTGFINGIKSKIEEAAVWASQLGKRTSEATANVMEIKSPSRVFKRFGQFAVEGLVIGLQEYAGRAYTAAGDVGTKAISGLQNAIANISTVVGNSIDMEPTIRPILDLSDVSSGAKKISDMLSRNTSLNAATSISKASSVVTPTKYVKETASINESGPKAQPERSGTSMTVNMSVRSPAEAIKELDIFNKKLVAGY